MKDITKRDIQKYINDCKYDLNEFENLLIHGASDKEYSNQLNTIMRNYGLLYELTRDYMEQEFEKEFKEYYNQYYTEDSED